MILFENLKNLTVSDLKKEGLLLPGIIKIKIVKNRWVIVNTKRENFFMELEANGVKIKIGLTTLPSNINKGTEWYFICPHTGLRCRKLYEYNGLFMHRKAIHGCYMKQTLSKKSRDFINAISL